MNNLLKEMLHLVDHLQLKICIQEYIIHVKGRHTYANRSLKIDICRIKIFDLILHIHMCTGAAWVSAQHESGFFVSLYKAFNVWIFEILGSLDAELLKRIAKTKMHMAWGAKKIYCQHCDTLTFKHLAMQLSFCT